MTDVTIRELQDLRELSDPPAPRPEPDPDKKEAAQDARFAEIQALIEKNRQILAACIL
jgi:hypothetical protein